MNNRYVMQRLRHPELLVFMLGGILGTSINFAFSEVFYRLGEIPAALAFFVATLLNEAFHHFFYRVVYVNEEIKFKTPLPIQLFLYVLVAAAGSLMLWAFMAGLGWGFESALLVSLVILAVSNAVLVRISTFASARLAEVEYREMNESFYDDQTDETKVSKFRAWYHRSRYVKLTRFILSYYKPGMAVADLGCGNCWWNTEKIPVSGVDINEKMLQWAKRTGHLASYTVSDDLSKTGLPDHSQDIVIISEVLEHLPEHKPVLDEVKRILKPGGTFLVTVPYDFFMGPFFILYNINCLYMGYVKGSVYHKYRCGHINHFTQSRLRATLRANGLELSELHVVNGLLLYGAAHVMGE